MPQSEHNGREFRWLTWCRTLLIVLTVASLSLSLATRFCHLSSSREVQIQANASSTMRQHMDRDATRWVAPVSRLIFLGTVAFYPRFAPAGPPLPSVLFDKSLYNRPPPSLPNLA
jgi:hypothetical protein